MIELHERLSEFSYGYGVTREVEQLLSSVGIRAVPFQPSLLQEKQVGFDVAFDAGGVALLLQFKLGQSLQRFVRSDKTSPAPPLNKPFFRFSIDTSEPDGQFETLLRAETDGASAYYVAPRFSDWSQYVNFFQAGEVLERSIIVTPGEIRTALVAKSVPDGPHRIVYDDDDKYVCSTPIGINGIAPNDIAGTIQLRLRTDPSRLSDTIRRIFNGLDHRAEMRRLTENQTLDEEELFRAERVPLEVTRRERHARFEQMRDRARSEEDAVAAAAGIEFWGLGIQLLFAVDAK